MRVFVTGATGFVGRALIPRLQRDGHGVVAWVRSPARARGLLGADGPRTVMEDRVYYTPPFGLFGRLANRVFIRSTLRKIFQYRGDVIRLRFGVS
jgi:nucleoside-diphosphate-sugar epimerase